MISNFHSISKFFKFFKVIDKSRLRDGDFLFSARSKNPEISGIRDFLSLGIFIPEISSNSPGFMRNTRDSGFFIPGIEIFSWDGISRQKANSGNRCLSLRILNFSSKIFSMLMKPSFWGKNGGQSGVTHFDDRPTRSKTPFEIGAR